MKHTKRFLLEFSACALASTGAAFAQFSPGPNPISGTVGVQTLSSGTGTINAGGAISIASGSGVPFTMTGTSALVNNGTIQTLGSGRAIDSNSGTANLTVTNNGLISSVSADAFRISTSASSVDLTNSGTIRVTAGGQAIDWAAITSGANTLENLSTGIITTVGEDAVRPGANGVIKNAGTITATPTGTTTPSGSDGIQANGSGVKITNSGSITGRHGITGGFAGFSITVKNDAGMITALNGSGLNIDDLGSTADVTNAFGATIKGGVLAASTLGDGDGVDVDGVLTLVNSGDILGLGAKGGTNNAEAVAAGGGSITNTATGRIIGSTLSADAPNGDALRAGNGILIDDSNGANAVSATTVTNSGLIQGKSGFAVKFIGNFADTVTNNAGGTLRGAGTGAAIQTGGGNDTVTNRGSITGDNGTAIDLGDGDDMLKIEGAAASIAGNVSGGTGTNTLTIDPGTGNSFSYSGEISNFTSVGISSGEVTLSGASTYSGTTTVAGTLTVTNTSGSAIGSGPVAIGSTGTLSGTGIIGANVSVAGGGIISPGLSPGTLTLEGDLALVNGSVLSYELGTVSDLIDLYGTLSFTGGGSAVFDILNAGGLQAGAEYTLVNFGDISGLTLSNLSFGSTPGGFSGFFKINSDSLSLQVDAVPEPSFALLGIMGLAATMLRRRRIA